MSRLFEPAQNKSKVPLLISSVLTEICLKKKRRKLKKSVLLKKADFAYFSSSIWKYDEAEQEFWW